MEKNLFLYFNVATCWKLSTMFLSISNRQHSKNWTYRVHQTWFRAFVYGKKKCFLYFNVATCWKLSTMLISSQIDSTAKIGHRECIKHDLELLFMEKNVFSVFQWCNLLKTVHNVHFILNRQHSKNWTSGVQSNMI